MSDKGCPRASRKREAPPRFRADEKEAAAAPKKAAAKEAAPKKVAAKRHTAKAEGRLTSEQARHTAKAAGLTLLVADNKAGYLGVKLKPGKPKPYQARVTRGGNMVSLGSFATAEEAALCFARSPEGQKAAERAAAAAPQLSEEESKGMVPPMPPGAFVKQEDMPSDAVAKDEGAVPSMPPDALVKVEVVVKEEQRSDRRPKRQRTK